MDQPEIEPRTGKPKHFEQVAFERWLDANPNGTTLLLDTIDVYTGAVHAAMAATSTAARRRAFKGFASIRKSGGARRVVPAVLCANGLPGCARISPAISRRKVKRSWRVSGSRRLWHRTKLSSEVTAVAGVIFKQCVMKDSRH
jgi:hypothetical protein